MAGIYIHIPFCKQACHYCNFHFSTSLKQQEDVLRSLHKELLLHSEDFIGNPVEFILAKDESIETIYFGGGTPSILPPEDIMSLLATIRKHYAKDAVPEITLEANPDDITPAKLLSWKTAGINRLSIGIQSFREQDLKWMNRAHDAKQAAQCLEDVKAVGFKNFSIDLIFGIPGLPDDEWQQNIHRVISAGTPHIACYALTVEPKTALHTMIRQGKKSNVDQEDQARQFRMLMDSMRQAGYEHYETSNFALPGFRSRHNSSYWQQKKYLGIGPSAHSFDGKNRFWNISNNALYIKALTENTPFTEKETLTSSQQFNEYLMTALRLMEGISLSYVEEHFGPERCLAIRSKIKKINAEWIWEDGDRIVLTDAGKLFTDGISVLLFE